MNCTKHRVKMAHELTKVAGPGSRTNSGYKIHQSSAKKIVGTLVTQIIWVTDQYLPFYKEASSSAIILRYTSGPA